jgi:hypothetical protein
MRRVCFYPDTPYRIRKKEPGWFKENRTANLEEPWKPGERSLGENRGRLTGGEGLG